MNLRAYRLQKQEKTLSIADNPIDLLHLRYYITINAAIVRTEKPGLSKS
jgi:hypothetical protein